MNGCFVMIANYTGSLPRVEEEAKLIHDTFEQIRDWDMEFVLFSNIEELSTASLRLSSKSVDFLHYSGHLDLSCIEILNDFVQQFRPRFCFLNCCRSKDYFEYVEAFSNTSIIYTNELIDDSASADFALKFYNDFFSGKDFAEAFRCARRVYFFNQYLGCDEQRSRKLNVLRHLNIISTPNKEICIPWEIRMGTRRSYFPFKLSWRNERRIQFFADVFIKLYLVLVILGGALTFILSL